MRKILLALAAFSVLALSQPAAAFSAYTDYSSVRMTSCSRATVYAYATNPESVPASLGISAQFGQLMGQVRTPMQNLSAYESRGSRIEIYSGKCFKGDEDVTIHYQFCRGANCQVLSRAVRVMVEPCTGCQSYTEQYLPAAQNYEPATGCAGSGCGTALVSDIHFEGEYMPGDYGAEISIPKEFYRTVAGQGMIIDAAITNRGEPVTVGLSIDGFADELGASLPESTIGLERGETRAVPITLDVPAEQQGGFCIALVASRAGYELDRKNLCVDVFDGAQARITAPTLYSIPGCKPANFSIAIRNTGVAPNVFTIASDNPAVVFSPAKLYLDPGEEREIVVMAFPEKSGEYALVKISVSGERISELDGSRFLQNITAEVRAPRCGGEGAVVNATEANRVYYSQTVSNPADETLKGVSMTIEGLPQGYSVMQDSMAGIDIAPGGSANLSLTILAPKDAAGPAQGMLVVRAAGGKLLSQRPITVNPGGASTGLTGFFSKAFSSNTALIIALVVGAAIVAILYAKRNGSRQGAGAAAGEDAKAGDEKKETEAAAATGEKTKEKTAAPANIVADAPA